MLSNKSLRIAGAAMLGTVAFLGTNAANAKINLDSVSKSDAVVTYAKETLTTAVTGKDGSTYYKVDGANDLLDVSGEVGVGGTDGSVLIIQYTFDGMVLTGASTPVLKVGGKDAVIATKRGGGGEGDNNVSFIMTRTVATGEDTTMAVLTLEDMAVSADVSGSVTMIVSDNLPLPATHTASYQGAVRVASALKPVATPINLVATVASKFLSFKTTKTQLATVGTFEVGLEPGLYKAANGTELKDLKDLVGLNDAGTTPNKKPIADTESSVTISGDFSFASIVTLSMDNKCGGKTDLRMDEDTTTKMRDTTQLKPQTLAYVNKNINLCIGVLDADNEKAVAIPETAPYMVTTKYPYASAIKDSKFPPPSGTHELGSIDRDGTTVQLPFLTTYKEYNQRLVIVNRGGAADYSMSFTPEDGVTATPGMKATGTLAARTTTVLSLQKDDVVRLEGGRTRTAATFIAEAEKSAISVATTVVNLGTRGTDTISYPVE